MAEVFISYSSHDIEVARTLYKKFEEQGISCWMDKSELKGGADWQENITTGIKSAKVFVLIYSAHAVESKWVLRELTLADDNHLFVIPYNIDGSSIDAKFELILARLQWINAQPQLGKYHFDELLGVSKTHVSSSVSGNIYGSPKYKVDLRKHQKTKSVSGNDSIKKPSFQVSPDNSVLRCEIEKIVVKNIKGWGCWYSYSKIKNKHFENAVASYASGITRDTIVYLYDGTVFGSAKEGIAVATDRICIKAISSSSITNELYCNIEDVSENGSMIIFKRKDGSLLYDSCFCRNPNYRLSLVSIIKDILELYKSYGYTCDSNKSLAINEESFSKESLIKEVLNKKIEQYAHILLHNNFGFVSFGNSINQKQLIGALSKYAMGVCADNVVAQIDTSLFNNGKEGFLLTIDSAVFSDLLSKKPIVVRYDKIISMLLADDSDDYKASLVFALSDGTMVKYVDSRINKKALIDIINSVKEILR